MAQWIVVIVAVSLVVTYKVMQFRAPPSPHIVCPYCMTQGTVKVSRVRRKRGISGGKATAAFFTLGTSMLATGLSRKETVNHCRCLNCGMQWEA